jgi:hypothetical protein
MRTTPPPVRATVPRARIFELIAPATDALCAITISRKFSQIWPNSQILESKSRKFRPKSFLQPFLEIKLSLRESL